MGLTPTIPAADTARVCAVCQAALRPGDLACPRCQTLVYAQQLDALSKQAQELESTGQLAEAREVWRSALSLVPRMSTQAEWVEQRVRALDALLAQRGIVPAKPQDRSRWAKWLGPLAPIAVVLSKLKGLLFILLKAKFLLSFALFLGVYWSLYGAWFGIGFAVQILLHELGHVFAVKRRGMKADLPVFLPLMGAYVRWQGMNIPIAVRAEIALAGPFFGLLASAACFGIFIYTKMPVFAALAHAGAWLNLVNLMPLWILDGGQAAYALNKLQRGLLLAACLIFFAVTGQATFLLVALGMLIRLFTHDTPSEPSTRTMIFFLLLLFALGGLLSVIPMQPGR
ncbi:MAG TPA: site-2 protease family protein [Granulicella sp.]